VPFLLTIRHNLEAAKDHFGENEVTRFAEARVRVGSGTACEQAVPDETFPELAFTVVADGNRLRLETVPGVGAFVNGETATDGTELLSGDEIRVGHWTCHVHKTYGNPDDRRRRIGLAWAARVLVVLAMAAELSVAVWLPRQVNQAAQRGTELVRLRTFALLDALRNRVGQTTQPEGTAPSPVELAVRQAVSNDLERRARYLRHYQNGLSADQCRQMYRELGFLADVLDRLATEPPLQPIPDVDADAAVRAVLQRSGWSSPTP